MDKYVVQKNVLHGNYSPGQTGTIVYRPILSFYLCPYYDRISPYRIGSNTAVYVEKTIVYEPCVRESACDVHFSSYFSVYHCFSPHTVTRIYDRNTGTGNMITRQKMVVYGRKRIVDGRLRPYTESVILDLSGHYH